MERVLMTLLAIGFLSIGSIGIGQQHYPNITGETLLEDDRVVVQRFQLEPGQWEGIHAHPEHQLVVVLRRSEQVTYRVGDQDTIVDVPDDQLGTINAFWRQPVTLDQAHESGNTGSRTLEWVAITFKDDSLLTSKCGC